MVEVASPSVVAYIEDYVKRNYNNSPCTIEAFNRVFDFNDLNDINNEIADSAILFAEVGIKEFTPPSDIPTSRMTITIRRAIKALKHAIYYYRDGTAPSDLMWHIKHPYAFFKDLSIVIGAGFPVGTVVISGYKVTVENGIN